MEDFDSFKALGYAVVERAVKDYRWALVVLKKQEKSGAKNMYTELADRYKRDCERFFLSDAFKIYCNVIDGERIIKAIRLQVEESFKKEKPIIIVDSTLPPINFWKE